MTNMKKTFFNKLLLATSSIGLLASAESFAAVVVPVPFYANNTSYLLDPMDARERPQDWRSNNGNRNYQPQNGDSIIFKGAHLINLNKTINIDEINIYGYAPRDLVDNYHNGINDPREMGGIAITSGFNDDTIVTINNIINSNANNYHIAGSNALGQALVYGNKNAKVRIDLLESAKNVKLIITGNISAVDSMVMSGGTNEIIFQRPIKVNTQNLRYECGM